MSPSEQELIHNLFDFTQTQVRVVMVPRQRIVGLDMDRPRQEIIQMVDQLERPRAFIKYPGSLESPGPSGRGF